MTRFVRSQYISTFCFCSIASFAASALPGSTTPVVRALTALPGTLVSGCVDERAAASLVLSVVFSFCAVLSESASFLFSVVRAVFVFVRAEMDLLRDVSSEVRDCRSATCCLRALITASWSVGGSVGLCGKRRFETYPLRLGLSASSAGRSWTPCLKSRLPSASRISLSWPPAS